MILSLLFVSVACFAADQKPPCQGYSQLSLPFGEPVQPTPTQTNPEPLPNLKPRTLPEIRDKANISELGYGVETPDFMISAAFKGSTVETTITLGPDANQPWVREQVLAHLANMAQLYGPSYDSLTVVLQRTGKSYQRLAPSDLLKMERALKLQELENPYATKVAGQNTTINGLLTASGYSLRRANPIVSDRNAKQIIGANLIFNFPRANRPAKD